MQKKGKNLKNQYYPDFYRNPVKYNFWAVNLGKFI